MSLALSIYLLEPLFQARNQSDLLESYRSEITQGVERGERAAWRLDADEGP